MVTDNTPAAIFGVFGVFVGIVATLAIVCPLLLRLADERDAARAVNAAHRRRIQQQAQDIADLQRENALHAVNVMAMAVALTRDDVPQRREDVPVLDRFCWN